MDSSQQFNRKEISKILKRAAELEQQSNQTDDGEALTLEELEQLSQEVGLHPEYIRRAAEELNQPTPSLAVNLIGGPFSYQRSASVRGRLTEEQWEEILFEIRNLSGNAGKSKKVGNIFEWEQRENDTGFTQIALSPKEDVTKININADYKDYAAAIYGAIGTLGVACVAILIPILYKKAGLPLFPLLAFGSAGILALAGGLRFYVSRWMKNKREKLSSIFNHIQQVLNPKEQRVHESDHIRLTDTPLKEPESHTSTSRPRQKS